MCLARDGYNEITLILVAICIETNKYYSLQRAEDD
jgi:hypothetical protein